MRKFFLWLIIALDFCPCLTVMAQNTSVKFTVSAAPEWTALFNRDNGWFGGDGIYSIPLNGIETSLNGLGANVSSATKTLFIFSDSMIGEIADGKIKPGAKMVHNTMAVLTGNAPVKKNLNFFWNQSASAGPATVFVPKTPHTAPADYYWLGDGFINQELDNAIYIFGYRIKKISDGTFGFKEAGNTLIKISAKIKIDAEKNVPFNNYTQKDTPFYIEKNGETGSFGAGIFVNTLKAGASSPDGYIYIYGVTGKAKNLLAARVNPKDFENYNKWMFWDGQTWNDSIENAAPLTEQVSNELSVSELADGRYVLVFQHGGMGREVAMRIGKTPVGPFGPVIKIWDCSADLINKNYFAYNAKAHPSLSGKGELLISYNINSFDFLNDLNHDPHFYRPRFIKVKFEE